MYLNRILAKELESVAVVRFQDCDPYGHLNNARCIDYFMNARQDQVAEAYDFHIFDYGRQTGQGWVVSKSQIAYLAPAHLMETVLIRTRLIQVTDHAIAVEGIMFDAEKTRPKAVAWVEFTFVNLASGLRARHPGELMAFFQSILVDDGFFENGFDERVQSIKGEFRFTLRPYQYADYAAMCRYHQTSPESHFTQRRVCSRATPEGRVTLSGMRLITTSNGERHEQELKDEAAYAEALHTYFGIVLTA